MSCNVGATALHNKDEVVISECALEALQAIASHACTYNTAAATPYLKQKQFCLQTQQQSAF